MITRGKRQRMNVPTARFHNVPDACTTTILTAAIDTRRIVRVLSITSRQVSRVLKTTAVRRHLVRLGLHPPEEVQMWKHWRICMRSYEESLRVRNVHWGLFRFPENAYVWKGELRPPTCSPYAGRNIPFECTLPRQYPFRPATIVFNPINVPLHPNIDPTTGRLFLSIESHSIALPLDSWMVAVQNLLSYPAESTVRGAANQKAAREYTRDPESWHRQARRALQRHISP